MKKIILLFVFTILSLNVFAQMKVELKTPVFRSFTGIVLPSVELITLKERIGIELGGGMNFRKAIINQSSFNVGTSILRFKKRTFLSTVSIKYYIPFNSKYGSASFYIGPMFSYSKVTFYEDAFFVEQERLHDLNPRGLKRFLGQRTISGGTTGGMRLITKANLIVALGIETLINTQELSPMVFENITIDPNMILKIGYRFGGVTKVEKDD